MFLNKQEKAFTLVELSIVISVMALFVSAIFSVIKLIESSKLNKLYSEKELYNSQVVSFRSLYVYYPGDLPNTSITADLLTTADYNVYSNTNYSLGGYLLYGLKTRDAMKMLCVSQGSGRSFTIDNCDTSGPNLAQDSADGIFQSEAGKNFPFAQFSDQAIWFIGAYASFNGTVSTPIQELVSTTIVGAHPYNYQTRNYIQLIGSRYEYKNGNNPLGNIASNVMAPALTISFSQKLSMKYSTGLPYNDANMIFVKSGTSAGINNASCTSAASTGAMTLTDTFAVSNQEDIDYGCVVLFGFSG